MVKKIVIGLLLIVAGTLIGHGIGEIVDNSAFQVIGLGVGLLGATIYGMKG